MPETSTTLFFAGLAAAAVIARYFLSSSGSRASDGAAPPRHAPREITEDLVDIVQVLVPHVDRSAIRADLEATRSVEATTQRLLAASTSNGETLPAKFTTTTDEEILARAEEPKPSNWIDDRQEREKHMKLQREKMIAKARLRTKQLQSQE